MAEKVGCLFPPCDRGLSINRALRKSKGEGREGVICEWSFGSVFKNILFKSSINTSGSGNALANTH